MRRPQLLRRLGYAPDALLLASYFLLDRSPQPPNAANNTMAGALGFEPRQADPESAVLPLHYAPVKKRFCSGTGPILCAHRTNATGIPGGAPGLAPPLPRPRRFLALELLEHLEGRDDR